MATWKRLTRTTGTAEKIDVNMDAVVHMQWLKDHTLMHFAVPAGEFVHTVTVTETPDQIHTTSPLAQAR